MVVLAFCPQNFGWYDAYEFGVHKLQYDMQVEWWGPINCVTLYHAIKSRPRATVIYLREWEQFGTATFQFQNHHRHPRQIEILGVGPESCLSPR